MLEKTTKDKNTERTNEIKICSKCHRPFFLSKEDCEIRQKIRAGLLFMIGLGEEDSEIKITGKI